MTEENRIRYLTKDTKFAGWLAIMLANLEEKKYCDEYGKIFKTDAQNKERAAYLAIFKWLSPEIAEKIDVSRIRTGTALLDCES
jgi:hypothetical protein